MTKSETQEEQETIRDVQQCATDWTIEHIDEFDPLKAEPIIAVAARRKAFNELTHNLMVRSHYDSIESQLHEFVIERANDPDYYRLLHRYPNEVSQFALPLIYAKRHDELETEPAQLLETVFERDWIWNTEQPAYQRLELLRLAKLLPGATPRGSESQIVERSFLARPPNVVTASVKEAYKLTHDIFFYLDYGREKDAFPSPPADVDLQTTLIGLLAREMARDQTDLVTELLAAGTLQRAFPRKMITVTIDWLAGQCENGYVRGPDLSEQPDSSITHGDFSKVSQEHRHWAENYHTNVAASFLLTIVESHLDTAPHLNEYETDELQQTLLTLGQTINDLSQYNLESGARTLRSLAAGETKTPFGPIVDQCRSFIEMQERADGSFGHWWSERTAMAANGERDVKFDRLVAGVTEECAQTLDAVNGGES